MEPGLIGLVGVALGILLSNLITRLLEQRRRHERTLDIVTAIHAEIVAGRDTAAMQTAEAEVAYIETNEFPFGPADDTDFVFASIKDDLTILPIEVLHEVVDYYKLAAQSNLYTADLKDPLFREQSPAERRKYLRNLIDLLREQDRAAVVAFRALEAFGEGRELKLRDKRMAAEARRSSRKNERPDGPGHDHG